MAWNYDSTGTYQSGINLAADGNIIDNDSSSTTAKTKTVSFKGYKTPTDGQTDTGVAGLFGEVMGELFYTPFDGAKVRIDAILED